MSDVIIAAIIISFVFIIGIIILMGLLGNIIKRAVVDALAEIKASEEYERSENEDDEEVKKYINQIENKQ
jgi:hypothetical protein